MFVVSDQNKRLIMPLFSLSTIKNTSSVANSVKMIDYLLNRDISYCKLSVETFKINKYHTFLNRFNIQVTLRLIH